MCAIDACDVVVAVVVVDDADADDVVVFAVAVAAAVAAVPVDAADVGGVARSATGCSVSQML